jgi:hypothetical protein
VGPENGRPGCRIVDQKVLDPETALAFVLKTFDFGDLVLFLVEVILVSTTLGGFGPRLWSCRGVCRHVLRLKAA